MLSLLCFVCLEGSTSTNAIAASKVGQVLLASAGLSSSDLENKLQPTWDSVVPADHLLPAGSCAEDWCSLDAETLVVEVSMPSTSVVRVVVVIAHVALQWRQWRREVALAQLHVVVVAGSKLTPCHRWSVLLINMLSSKCPNHCCRSRRSCRLSRRRMSLQRGAGT